jgi:hypothetical protein
VELFLATRSSAVLFLRYTRVPEANSGRPADWSAGMGNGPCWGCGTGAGLYRGARWGISSWNSWTNLSSKHQPILGTGSRNSLRLPTARKSEVLESSPGRISCIHAHEDNNHRVRLSSQWKSIDTLHSSEHDTVRHFLPPFMLAT